MKFKSIAIANEDEFARLIRRMFLLMYLVGFGALGLDFYFKGEDGLLWPFFASAIVVAILLVITYFVFIGYGKREFTKARNTAIQKMQADARVNNQLTPKNMRRGDGGVELKNN